MSVTRVSIPVSSNVVLEAVLGRAQEEQLTHKKIAVLLTHPHSKLGGDMNNNVVGFSVNFHFFSSIQFPPPAHLLMCPWCSTQSSSSILNCFIPCFFCYYFSFVLKLPRLFTILSLPPRGTHLTSRLWFLVLF